jgi:hypothetical protein
MHNMWVAKLLQALQAVAPLIVVVSLLQVTVVHAPLAMFFQFLLGATLAIAGMLLLFTGIDAGILPMGRYIGAELPGRRSLSLIVAVAFALGFATTAAEPDVLVLARQVEKASAGKTDAQALIYLISAGAGLLTAAAMLRVVTGIRLTWLLAVLYGVMITLSVFAPADFLPLAYDAGSVTTGVLTAPVVLAFALGFTSVLAGRSSADAFGLLGIASIGPIIAVLLLGIALR